MLDLAGLGLIAPYIALVLQPNSVAENWAGKMIVLMGWELDPQAMLLWFSGVLVFLFMGKADDQVIDTQNYEGFPKEQYY